jgi:hypothetical protein
VIQEDESASETFEVIEVVEQKKTSSKSPKKESNSPTK